MPGIADTLLRAAAAVLREQAGECADRDRELHGSMAGGFNRQFAHVPALIAGSVYLGVGIWSWLSSRCLLPPEYLPRVAGWAMENR